MEKATDESALTIPICDVRFTLQEVRQRMKVIEQISGFIEEQSDNENRFGLALQKVNTHAMCARGDWLPVVTAEWEKIIKATAAVGKQHVNRSLSVSSNATKAFPELIKSSMKKLVVFVTKIQGQLEDMHKAKKAVRKAEDKYKRAVTELDAGIKVRDAAIAAFTAGEALPAAAAAAAAPLNMKSLAMGGATAAASGAGAAVTPDAINRLQLRCKELFRDFESCEQQVATMMERFTRLRADYCVEAAQCNAELLELERGARMPASSQYIERFYMSTDLFVSRCSDALGAASPARGELSVEAEVASFLATLKTLEDEPAPGRESEVEPEEDLFEAFQPSPRSSGDEPSSAAQTLVTTDPALSAAEEDSVGAEPVVVASVAAPAPAPAPAPVATTAGGAEAASSVCDVLDQGSAQTGAVVEHLDLFRASAGRAQQHLADVLEAERAYIRASSKTMDKFGLSRELVKTGLSPTALTYFKTLEPQLAAAANAAAAAATAVATDSSSLQACWDGVVRFYVSLFDAHASSADLIASRLMPQCEQMLRKAEQTKREALERQRQYGVKLQSCRGVIHKANARLHKLQKELKERRGAIKVDDSEGGVRDSLTRESGAGTAGSNLSLGAQPGATPALPPREVCSPGTVPSDPLNASIDSIDTELPQGDGAATAVAAPAAPAAAAAAAAAPATAATTAPMGRRKSMMAGFDKFVRGTQKLGAAVGLATAETAEARVARIQHQIAEMEEEEVLCVRDADAACAALHELNSAFMVALAANVDAVKATLLADVDFLHSAALRVGEALGAALEGARTSGASVHSLFSAIDLEADVAGFVKKVRLKGSGSVSAGVASLAASVDGAEEAGNATATTGSPAVADAGTYAAILRSCSSGNETMLSAIGLKKPAVGITSGALSSVTAHMSSCSVAEEWQVLEELPDFRPVRTELIDQEFLNQNQSRGRGTSFAVPGAPGSSSSNSGSNSNSGPASPEVDAIKKRPDSGDAAGTAAGGSPQTAAAVEGSTGDSGMAGVKTAPALEPRAGVTGAADDSGSSSGSGNPGSSPRPPKMNRRRSRSFDQHQMQSLLRGEETEVGTVTGAATVDGTTVTASLHSRIFSNESEQLAAPACTPVSTGKLGAALNLAGNAVSSASGPQGNSGVLPELVKFGLSVGDRIIESHACAYYPKRGLMSQGRMYITQHFVAFSSWDGTRILLPLYYIKSIEKANSLFIISNALLIKTCSLAHTRAPRAKKLGEDAGAAEAETPAAVTVDVDSAGAAGAAAVLAGDEGAEEEYNFGSFVDRDQCFSLLQRLQEIEKRLYSMNTEEMTELLITSGLVFGNQKLTDKEPAEETAAAAGAESSSAAGGEPTKTPVARRTSMAMFSNIMKGKKDEAPALLAAPAAPAAVAASVTAAAAAPVATGDAAAAGEVVDAATAAADEALFADACAKNRLKVPCFSGELLPVSVGAFLSHFVEDSATYGLTQHHEVCGDNSMVLQPWEERSGGGGRTGTAARAMKFMKVCNLPGLKQTRGTKSQTLHRCGSAGFVIYTTTKLDDVPFADVFTVDDCFIVRAAGPQQVSVEASMEVKYVKSSMMKTFIDGSTNKEVVAWCKDFLVELRKQASALPGAVAVQTSGAAAGAAVGGAAGAAPVVVMQTAAAAPAPMVSDTYAMVIAGLLALLAFLLLLSLIQQYRSHYYIIQHIDALLMQRGAGDGGAGSCQAPK